MPGIFISHSSVDKTFVRRLATDLLQEGMPVWLDEWELDIGDSLIERIYAGIDAGSYFILVMSKASIGSGWVAKEMTAALIKEEQLGRRFLIPILLDADIKAPLQVADRLYADFSKGYLVGLEGLIRRLRSDRLHEIVPSGNRIVIPLSFARDTHLDDHALEARISHVMPALQKAQRLLEPRDFYVCTSSEYQTLRSKLIYRMEHIADDSYYTPDFELGFKTYYRDVLDMERKYVEGICLILNNLVIKGGTNFCNPFKAAKWFSIIWRSSLISKLWQAQNPSQHNIEYGRDFLDDRMGTRAQHYGLEENALRHVDVGPIAVDEKGVGVYLSDAFAVYIGPDESLNEAMRGALVKRIRAYDGGMLFTKYVIPQMTARIVAGIPGPYSWTFEGYGAGPG